MKTTLELSDDLMRRIKLRAVHRKRLRGSKPVTLAEIESAITAGQE